MGKGGHSDPSDPGVIGRILFFNVLAKDDGPNIDP